MGLIAPAVMANTASAAVGDVGYQGPSTAGTTSLSATTGEKPESKLWFTQDNVWWAWLWNGSRYDIARLDTTTHTWVFQGLNLNETRGTSRADALYDPAQNRLYVASHQFKSSNASTTDSSAARLYRLIYTPASKSWALETGYPATIVNKPSETMTIDKDANGRLYATWTQDQKVFITWSTSSNKTWAAPIVLPTSVSTGLDIDDIATIVSYQNGSKVGVLWENQTANANGTSVFFASINAGANPASSASWSTTTAYGPGPGYADDHLNIKSIDSDGSGRIFAVVKTSADAVGGASSATSVALLSRTAGGSWSSTSVATLADCPTRGSLLLDKSRNLIHVYLTAPDTGCVYSGQEGSIFEKTASMDNPVFGSGRGTPVIRDAGTAAPDNGLNNVTSTKQEITSGSGIVLLASNSNTQRYWHAEQFISGGGTTTTSTTAPPTTTTTIPQGSGITSVGSTATVAPAASQVVVTKPAGVRAGDVLVASMTLDNAPTVTAPAGWTRLANMPIAFTGALTDVYYRVATSSEPATYTWTLSSAQKYGAGVTAYRGVNNANPIDTTVSTAKQNGVTTSLTVSGVTTTRTGAALIGGIGLDAKTGGVTPPGSFAQLFSTDGEGQVAEQATRTLTTSGASGAQTWTFSLGRSSGGWLTALRPA